MARKIEYTENRHLDCELTDEEVKQYGEDLAHRLMDIAALELEKSRLNVKIKPIKDDVERLIVKIDTKQEVKEIVCEWHFDWKAGTKRLIRTDTFDEVPRTMVDISEDEKQQKFEMEDD